MMSRMFCFVPPLLWLVCSALAQSPEPLDRLPTTVTPVNYVIHLEPDVDSYTVTGTVMITFQTISNQSVPMTSVVMHLGVDVTVDEDTVTLMEMSGQMKAIGAIEYYDSATLIKVVLPDGDSLEHNQMYVIYLNFTSLLYSEPTGLFTGYINSTSWYIASNFRPTFARNVFPCFDEPHFKTPVTLQVLRPATYSAVSTAPLQRSLKTKVDGMILDTFVTTNPISIHSLGLFISELSPLDSPMGVTLYAPSEFPATVPFLESLLSNISSLVGPFPLVPLNLVVLPDQLKMHLASYGFIFTSSDIYGYNEENPSFSAHDWLSLQLQLTEAFLLQFLEFSKTPMWWSHMWLSEAVGAYLAAYMLPEVFPWLNIEIRSEVLVMDFDNWTLPVIDSKIGSHWDIEKAVASQTIRNKGLGVLIMWSNTLPEDTVYKTIIDFIKLHKPVVTTSDFLEVLMINIELNKTYNVTLAAGQLPLWLNTSGYPIVTYTPQSEHSFLLSQQPEDSRSNSTFWPVSVTLAKNSSRDWNHYRWGYWLLNGSSSFPSGGLKGSEWLILNLESGLYRVDYNQSWGIIQNALQTDLLPSNTPDSIKATIQDDAVALSLKGNIPFSTAFAVLTSTKRYMLDWYPVAKAFEAFSNIIGSDKDVYEDFKLFAASLFSEELLADLDLQKKPSSKRIQYIRSVMTPWLCQFNIGNCRQSVAKLFDQILQGVLDKIDPGDLENVVCFGAQYNSSVLTMLLSAYSKSSTVQLRHLYTTGLGCLSDTASVLRVLNLLVDSPTPFSTRDAKEIILNLASRITNSATIIEFLSQYASTTQSVLGSGCLADVLQTLGKFRINMTKVQSLANDQSLEPYVVHSALRAVSRTNTSWAWWSTNAADLDSALPQKRTTTTTTTTSSPSSSLSSSISSSSYAVSTSTEITTTSPTTIRTTTTSPTGIRTTTTSPTTIRTTTTSPTGIRTTTTSPTTVRTTTPATTERTTPGTTPTTVTNGTSTGTTLTTVTNGTTPATTVTVPPTEEPTSATSESTPPSPSSCPESLSTNNVIGLVLTLAMAVISTSS